MKQGFYVSFFKFLSVECPGSTILGIFHFEAEGGQRITNLVACGPVLVGFGDSALFKEHIYDVSESFLSPSVSC